MGKNLSFSQQVEAWIKKVEAKQGEVLAGAARDLFEEANRPREQGGRLPVDSGELRDSLTLRINGTVVAEGDKAYQGALLAEFGDTIVGTWDAKYAVVAEFGSWGGGTNRREGTFFATSAAMSWPQHVKENARRVAKKK